jgi:pimeloyl-ACP methyl ester carboxylesterase
MSVNTISSEFHLINDGEINRKIAYSRIGQIDAKNIFLCLPGLLETRESFHPLFSIVESYDACCWLSLDYCGRGDSDPLPPTANYSISKYLADTQDLIESLILPRQLDSSRKFHLIGTSMGGILAMHLVNRFQDKVGSVVLNDIGLYLHWSSLMSLYKSIKESDQQINKLRVDPRALNAVRSQSHFDLPYEFDLFGMLFYSLLQNFKGQVVLLHNAESPICSLSIANQSKSKYADLIIWTLNKQGHPANWEKSTATKLAQMTKLKPRSLEKEKPELIFDTPEAVQTTSTISLDFVDAFLTTSHAYFESTIENRSQWIGQLVNRLRSWRGSYS